MTIPELPPFFDMDYTTKEGKLTSTSKLFNDNVFQTLNSVVSLVNSNLNVDWAIMPNKSTAEISTLEPSAPLGAMWFNTNLSKLQVKTASGVIQTITST